MMIPFALIIGCASQDKHENLLYEDEVLLIARAAVPSKKDLEQKDTCHAFRWQWPICKHGLRVSPWVCVQLHCGRPSKK
jgi:hypothetical protein